MVQTRVVTALKRLALVAGCRETSEDAEIETATPLVKTLSRSRLLANFVNTVTVNYFCLALQSRLVHSITKSVKSLAGSDDMGVTI